MTPIAFHIGRLAIYWYGICMAAAFLAGYGMSAYLAPKRGLAKDAVGDLLTWAIIGGLVGARLLFVLENFGEYASHPLSILNVREGGLVFYGGFIVASLVVAWRAKVKKMSPWSVADVLAVALPLGHSIGRIGCFLHGCCHGLEYDGSCAVHYAIPDESYFPIQLVASAGNLCLSMVMLVLFTRKNLRGRLFPVYLMLYSVIRFCTEFARGDYPSHPGGLTPAQWVCFLTFPAGVILWRITGKRQSQTDNPKAA
jgi:phosphatidylglycerol:prolipoprotein diacylglycerol transferase